MKRPKICAVVTENDYKVAAGISQFVDFYEVRIDLIGDGWQGWVGRLNRPWIACNRLAEEGGNWSGSEKDRVAKLFEAIEAGARIVDIELRTDGLYGIVEQIKEKEARCLISVHNLKETPNLKELKVVIGQELAAGADICKVATTALRFEDNLTLLRLFRLFPGVDLVALAMGEVGVCSRVLSPMLGSYLTYASLMEGKESAAGQLSAYYLRSFYEAVHNENG